MANEKRLIDANALIAYFKEQCEIASKDGEIESLYTLAALNCCIDCFEHFPTVDAVEVVRCKDCKHWHEETEWCYHHSHFINAKNEFCHPWESNDWKMFDADYFCADGERKDNG